MTDMHVPAIADRGEVTQPADQRLTPPGSADGKLPAIELSAVTKEFHARGEVVTAVRQMDLQIREGEFFSLLQ